MDDSKIFMFPDGGTRQTSSDVNKNSKSVLISMKKGIIVMTMTLSIEVVILMTTKNVIAKEKNMGIVSVVVTDVINMKSAP